MKVLSTTYSNVQITPYQLVNLHELIIEKQLNHHTRLKFTAIVPEELKDTYVEMTEADSLIEVSQITEEGERLLIFSGTVLDIEVKFVRGVYYLEVEAISHTYKLDICKKSRSFQDKHMKMAGLLEVIANDYPGIDIIDSATAGASLNQLTIQYRETDWEFLKRIASRYHTSLMPASTFSTPKFYFGVEEVNAPVNLENYHYTISKRMSSFRYFSENGTATIQENHFIDYVIETNHVLELGNQVIFHGKTLFVYKALTEMSKGILKCIYTLTSHEGLRHKEIFNEQMIGLSLQGKVIALQRDRVKVHLEIDLVQAKDKAHWFPYATGYTAEGHSGWYVMPEIGDTVRVYFPAHQEQEGFASSSARQDRTKDGYNKIDSPDTKIFRTPHGKEIRMTPDEIVITGKDGAIFIQLNQGSGIQIVSDKDISFSAGGNIRMSAGKKIKISAGEEVALSSQSSNIVLGGDTSVIGSEVKTN
ncbi:phage baseplate assembly protein V [Paenibacillus kribbensis]|uniref:phage baseplate assembly protein V n=1 Tax=Paenibacillus kribbensis TaxID=172713 RepID=UPI002DB8C4A0|nr:phage baseplate assembly protein V [Paenibacillus kribbensis]MEC0235054.1 phage baseplate assembly protein V [Paenibacillus kribbensis]